MNTPTILLISLVSFAMVWVYLFWIHEDLIIDKFRQDMFRLRDKLFDDAARGAISFDHPAYGMLRTTMNGFIRYAHILNLVSFIAVMLGAHDREPQGSFANRFTKSMGDLNDKQRKLCSYYVTETNKLVLRHILFNSPILLATMVIPIALYVVIRKFIGRALALLRAPLDDLDSIALAAGDG